MIPCMWMSVQACLFPALFAAAQKEATRLKAFADWTASACKRLLSSTYSQVLEFERPSALNAAALAGMMLCYPFVYDILEDDNNVIIDDKWAEQKNSLAMCPLWLFQIKAVVLSKQIEMALQEFSVPQHLLDNGTTLS
ncbi:unnamed protein product [Peronospora belbahrii]|uniref:Uncharacterized protein n=1 Tax=Peronospora belbahrii TaxID=622444 RepID=A0AAU9KZH7_9STRA|nr:unnamed protein product [Peronospora belbahrii]CAH0477669.1 unnamed protein product [Peronospora belbahrii]CAH0517211.1 unnamed protein product [Peronospora belbahrii]